MSGLIRELNWEIVIVWQGALIGICAKRRFIARELDRTRRRIAIGELDAGRQADPLSHRRERKAAVGVPHRVAECGIALDAIMHVVAALYRQGDLIAERSKDIVGPRTESHYHFAGLD